MISLPQNYGSFESLAAWDSGTYIVAPTCSAYLGLHISRTGEVLRHFGDSDCRAGFGGFQLANHTHVFTNRSQKAIYAVDVFNGRITVWGEKGVERQIALPSHPFRGRILADLDRLKKNSDGGRLVVMAIYGVPSMGEDGRLFFPGVRSDDTKKSIFSLDAGIERVTTYRPLQGARGYRILTNGKEGVLIDKDKTGPTRCYFFNLVEENARGPTSH